jgi:hypothetical protein
MQEVEFQVSSFKRMLGVQLDGQSQQQHASSGSTGVVLGESPCKGILLAVVDHYVCVLLLAHRCIAERSARQIASYGSQHVNSGSSRVTLQQWVTRAHGWQPGPGDIRCQPQSNPEGLVTAGCNLVHTV